MRERVVAICPGRGTYTKTELGYLKPYRPAIDSWIQEIDQYLESQSARTVSELDGAAQFSPAVHTPGENASTLIYACSLADFLAIDQNRFEVVAVTGNSLGWYTALALGGALNHRNATHLVYTMGSMMKEGVIGAQIVYPLTREDWTFDAEKVQVVQNSIDRVWENQEGKVYPSIRFGGYAVIGGDEPGIRALTARLPKIEDKYPLRLVNHAAFHTPILENISERAQKLLGLNLFQKHLYPLIDGRGVIWQPYAADLELLRNYTLQHQITQTYDFYRAIVVALKEFAPDRLILLGPGATSGGAIGQIIVNERWHGITSKEQFIESQQQKPFLISMGIPNQRALVVS